MVPPAPRGSFQAPDRGDRRGGGGNATGPAEYDPPLSPRIMAGSNATTRSLLEVTLGFLGALLVVPLLFKVLSGLVKGVFRLGTTRRLVGDVVVAGLTALLTREDVLDTLFGRKGKTGDGLLKPPVD